MTTWPRTTHSMNRLRYAWRAALAMWLMSKLVGLLLKMELPELANRILDVMRSTPVRPPTPPSLLHGE